MADTGTVVLSGSLKTTGGTPVAGVSVDFTDTAGDKIASATTDANGNFSATATVAAGQQTFTASFAGSATDKGSTATATATILAGTVLTLNVVVQ